MTKILCPQPTARIWESWDIGYGMEWEGEDLMTKELMAENESLVANCSNEGRSLYHQ